MPRTTKKEVLAERQDASTPALFDERALPVRQDLVDRIREGRYLHTGARLLDDDAKALRMVELLCVGWGIERIARDMQVSPHSVRAAKRELVRQGKMAGWKERVVQIWEDMIEAGSVRLRDAMEAGTLPVAQIAFPVGLFFDKRAVSQGEPTSIYVGATAELKPENLSVQRLNDFFARPPLEDESGVKAEVIEQIAEKASFDVDLAAADDRPLPPIEVVPVETATGESERRAGRRGDGGGGG